MMWSAALNAIIVAGLTVASRHITPQPPNADEFTANDLAYTLKSSDFAEIYIIPPWISFASAPTPATVRLSGCKFFVSRHARNGDTAEWVDLAKRLTGLEIEAAPDARQRQVYYALVLGDEKGTIREIYVDHLAHPTGKVWALDDRRQVHLPERFSAALFAFAARHPELAQGPSERCPSLDVPWPRNR